MTESLQLYFKVHLKQKYADVFKYDYFINNIAVATINAAINKKSIILAMFYFMRKNKKNTMNRKLEPKTQYFIPLFNSVNIP